MYIAIIILFLLTISVLIILNHPKFGKLPSGDRLKKIQSATNYSNGTFQNQSVTPDLTEGANYFSVMREFFFNQNKRVTPIDIIPSEKTDLLNLDINKDVLVLSLIHI